jgi:hypothetical protein
MNQQHINDLKESVRAVVELFKPGSKQDGLASKLGNIFNKAAANGGIWCSSSPSS